LHSPEKFVASHQRPLMLTRGRVNGRRYLSLISRAAAHQPRGHTSQPFGLLSVVGGSASSRQAVNWTIPASPLCCVCGQFCTFSVKYVVACK
jgi:hypothetical protein